MTSVDTLAGDLGDSFTRTGHWAALSGLFQPLLELLATGQPVTAGQLASATGRDAGQVRDTITGLPGIELNPQGNIVGYGLTQLPTPHHFEVNGRQLYTWCALDTLIFPILLGATAEVTSPCHATAVPVQLTVEPDTIGDVHPATAVMSIVTPQDMTDVRAAFCHDVHYFASADAAQPWLAAHPGSTVLPVTDAYALARKLAVVMFTDISSTEDCC